MSQLQPCQLQGEANHWQLLGDLGFHSVPDLLRQAQGQLDFSQALHIDLGQIRHADSAGLALMLEWLEQSQRAKGQLSFHAIPEALQNIARLCNVAGFFGSN
ncbi:MAG: STAS domain-containing protein [Gammaproteobacteria bacterium SHHR-1]|uniref:STAS domain-containing protein n=1 Tax=Magnetovirga frankeli TaxID=947516 RepID=UPI001AF3E726|nr:STAS domain-containing protein [gamma proteobacterium SS-5]